MSACVRAADMERREGCVVHIIYALEIGFALPLMFLKLGLGHSWMDCKTRLTRGESGASPGHLA